MTTRDLVSIHLMLFFILFRTGCSFFPESCFNTSHVILYQIIKLSGLGEDAFQYISCYSLSCAGANRRKSENRFQYISCYSLSRKDRLPVVQTHVSIHLMLFFIDVTLKYNRQTIMFQYISCYSLSDFGLYPNFFITCFNTSHVILYQFCHVFEKIVFFVSIHLMLFFIRGRDKRGRGSPVFQYISCYSLSNYAIPEKPCYCVSIHLMLFFIYA